MMKRLLLIFLALAILLPLASCGDKDKDRQNEFLLTNEGYTDSETGVWYRCLPYAYEPVKSADTRGVALYPDGTVRCTFLEMPDLDSKLWLCDDTRAVWYAGEWTVEPSTLTPRALLVCEEHSFSLERARLVQGTDDALIEEILSLWFTGASVAEPAGQATLTRRLRLVSAELPGIYYCFDFYMVGEQGYFVDRMAARFVALPDALGRTLAAY
ncbi:MAG: hypothetical protein IJC99_00975 [Clostridia bacterium]|nr:hypothetical protein [Clostridia bacterium]